MATNKIQYYYYGWLDAHVNVPVAYVLISCKCMLAEPINQSGNPATIRTIAIPTVYSRPMPGRLCL